MSADELQRGVVLVLGHRLALLLHLAPAFPQSAPAFGLVGEAPAMVRVRQEIEMVGELDTPVLLRGESGTGKELVARAIHRAGPRRLKDYVPLNMAAMPTSLAAAELFGAARGALDMLAKMSSDTAPTSLDISNDERASQAFEMPGSGWHISCGIRASSASKHC